MTNHGPAPLRVAPRWLCLLFALGGAVAVVGPARAEPAAAPVVEDSGGDARTASLLQEALVQRRAGEREAALQALQRAYQITPRPSYLFLMAEVHQEAGNNPQAIALYQRYLKQSPGAADRRYVEEQIEELKQVAAPPVLAPPRRSPPPPAPDLLLAANPPPREGAVRPSAPVRGSRLVWILSAAGAAAAAGVAVGLGLGLRPTQASFLVAPGAQP